MDQPAGTLIDQVQDCVNDIEQSIQCCICMGLLRNPVGVSCNHSFCKACLDDLFNYSKQAPKCPLCNGQIRRRGVSENLELGQIADSFQKVLDAMHEDLQGFIASQKEPNYRLSPELDLSQLIPHPEKVNQIRSNRLNRDAKRNPFESIHEDIEEEEIEEEGEEEEDGGGGGGGEEEGEEVSNHCEEGNNEENETTVSEESAALASCGKAPPMIDLEKEQETDVDDSDDFMPPKTKISHMVMKPIENVVSIHQGKAPKPSSAAEDSRMNISAVERAIPCSNASMADKEHSAAISEYFTAPSPSEVTSETKDCSNSGSRKPVEAFGRDKLIVSDDKVSQDTNHSVSEGKMSGSAEQEKAIELADERGIENDNSVDVDKPGGKEHCNEEKTSNADISSSAAALIDKGKNEQMSANSSFITGTPMKVPSAKQDSSSVAQSPSLFTLSPDIVSGGKKRKSTVPLSRLKTPGSVVSEISGIDIPETLCTQDILRQKMELERMELELEDFKAQNLMDEAQNDEDENAELVEKKSENELTEDGTGSKSEKLFDADDDDATELEAGEDSNLLSKSVPVNQENSQIESREADGLTLQAEGPKTSSLRENRGESLVANEDLSKSEQQETMTNIPEEYLNSVNPKPAEMPSKSNISPSRQEDKLPYANGKSLPGHSHDDMSFQCCIEESERFFENTVSQNVSENLKAPACEGHRGNGKVILITGVDGLVKENHEIITEFFQKFCETCKPVLEMNDEVTHAVIAADDSLLALHRTAKALVSMLRGIWVCSFKWLKDSIAAGKLLMESDYEVQGFGKVTNGPRIAREKIFKNPGANLFPLTNYVFIIFGAVSLTSKKEILVELVTVCGCKGENIFVIEKKRDLVQVLSRIDKQNRSNPPFERLTLIVLTESSQHFYHKNKLSEAEAKYNTVMLRPHWLLDSICALTPLQYEAYRVYNDPR
eukprot:Nk52_evm126s226 gene=Nk52_evmTU126s226